MPDHEDPPKLIGPPKPAAFVVMGDDDPLSIEWRSCLLRGARRQLLALEDEMARYRGLDSRYSGAVIEATQMEIDCLQQGIAWLWRQKS